MKNVMIKALQGLGIAVIGVAFIAVMGYAMLLGPDDSDDANLQAFEDRLAEERWNDAQSRVASAEPPENIELTEDERSLKYQEAKNIEEAWVSYAQQEAERRRNPNPNAGYLRRPEKDMNDALGLYVEVAHTESVAIDDVVRVSGFILESPDFNRDHAVYALLEFYAKVDNEKIKAVLANAVIVYKKELLATGFDPSLRYRSTIDFKGLSFDDARSQVTHCGKHANHVEMIGKITAALKTEDEKKWALHATDLKISDFCCDCTGEPRPETESNGAYERYVELGDVATAKIVALELAQANAYTYANGWEPIESYNPDDPDGSPQPIPILGAEYKIEAEAWYALAGWDKGTVETVFKEALRRAAKEKEGEERYDEARDLYKEVGDAEQARKMELLAGPNADNNA